MRLTCPNCSAEYEVDASVIPAAGRDVQCSNCSHTWFQAPLGGVAAPPQAITPKPVPDRSRVTRTAVERAAVARREKPFAPPPADGVERPAADFIPPPFGQTRKPVDEDVLKVLRAEAEREQKVRRGEPVDMFQDQPELALTGAAPQQVRRIISDPHSALDEELVPTGTIGRRRAGDAGRNVLPDIEEINSSLRSSVERPDSVPAYVEVEKTIRKMRRGQGFRLGFSVILAAMAAALFIYIFADELATRWPEYAPYIERYVAQANDVREILDQVIRDLTEWLTTLITENTG